MVDLNSKCPNYKSLAIVNSLVELKNKNGKSFISLVLDVKEDIKGSVKVSIYLFLMYVHLMLVYLLG